MLSVVLLAQWFLIRHVGLSWLMSNHWASNKMLQVDIPALRGVTCQMRSHIITCHLTQINTSRLNSTYIRRNDWTLSWPCSLLYTEWFICSLTIAHSNERKRARHGATTVKLIETNALTVTGTPNRHVSSNRTPKIKQECLECVVFRGILMMGKV